MERETNLTDSMVVGFWGKFIPLQGVPVIVRAAKILAAEKGIFFELIGSGQTFQESSELAKQLGLTNLEFTGLLAFEDLPARLKNFDVGLGIFGATPKTQRVIPNKIYEALALAKPVITAATPAIEELFTDRQNILLCQTADPADLAAKILLLKNDPVLRQSIAHSGYRLYQEQCRPAVIGKQLLNDLGC